LTDRAGAPMSQPARHVLLIAYHFPPIAGSSGVQRTLRFVQQLPRFGWQPLVLTCHPRAYEAIAGDLVQQVPPGTVVQRAFALDTSRHLSIGGRYVAALARPDRWLTWWPSAVQAGLRLIRRYRPAAMFSTYPIATAHMIGASLARRSAVPWVADFRDPMAQDDYPPDRRTWQSFKRIEERVFDRAAAASFTTPSAAQMYRERYAGSATRIEVIENGYDEDSFADADRLAAAGPLHPQAVTLLHSGIVYPSERDPSRLFEALGRLKAGGVDGRRLRVRFRAAVHDDLLRDLARAHDVTDMIELMPHAPYREALAEMVRADVLLVLQAANCNAQVPAKLYEYLRARRPLLALTDAAGDTATVLRAAGIRTLAPLDDASAIAATLQRVAARDFEGMSASEAAVQDASRLHRCEQLAHLLTDVADHAAVPQSPAVASAARP
jgi:glycosyltransferase involved in cell wall biosynthesis